MIYRKTKNVMSLFVKKLASTKVVIRLLSSLCSIGPVGLFFLGCCATALIFFIRFYQWTDTSYVQMEVEKKVPPRGHRGTCCLSVDRPEDICGRANCTSPCLQLGHFTPALEGDSAKLCSQEKERAFFLETSGSGSLNFRQACSVESLTLHNPNLTVHVLFVDVPINYSVTTLLKLKNKYSNLRFVSINLNDYIAGTPLEHWYHCTDWRQGPFHVSHLSDGLRFLTLHKYGGYYFDLDVIVMQPVTYYRNFVGAAADGQYVASGVIHADRKNTITKLAVEELVRNYRSDIWGHNGPDLLLRVLKNWCEVEDLQSMNYVTCRGFNVLPKSSFQPLHHSNAKEFFAHRLVNQTTANPVWLTKNVIGVHTFNNLSKGQPIHKNSTQIYTGLARHNCPVIFSAAPDVF
ncbi:hypothetical protein OUZ56_019519 [Daphnia magna]|uniref:Alpha 1,4-glycosyltransferase domain-containing protein n=1 Tax=Daphnia magna TaxID=35525 RepID=A0ABQ9ZCK8_9CRUS|nr:hypothetical protein OUZ56_019519 [Daphnia magna]